MSRWMPPQRVQRKVQYSQPPRPARPGMILSTTSPPLHSGQADSTGSAATAGSTSISGIRRSEGRSLAAQPEAVDMVLGVGDCFFGAGPGEADIEGGKRNAVDHKRLLVGPADPRMPQAFPRLEGFDVKTVIKARHLGLRVLLDSHENTERPTGL